MNVEMRPIHTIRPYENNPRQNDAGVDAVAASLREFGWRQPIVVDEDGIIIVGHGRYKAALKLGWDEVPIHVATDLTPEQIKAYRIADNKTADLSDWNYELLPIELSQLQSMNYDLGLLGFDQDELAKLLGTGVTEGLCDPDEVPEPPDEAITRPGDLWLLGPHRLLCGDSSTPREVDRLLDGAAIHLVNTDPPYNVRVEPRSNNARAAGLTRSRRPEPRLPSCVPRTDRLQTTSSPIRSSSVCCTHGSATSLACSFPVARSIFGAATATVLTILLH